MGSWLETGLRRQGALIRARAAEAQKAASRELGEVQLALAVYVGGLKSVPAVFQGREKLVVTEHREAGRIKRTLAARGVHAERFVPRTSVVKCDLAEAALKLGGVRS